MKDFGVLRNLALITQIGLSMALPVIFGILAGRYLDRVAGTGNLLLMVFSILGVLVSFRNLYYIAYKSSKRK